MESELVRRRINLIASHFAPTDEISSTHVLPMNCSGSLNSVLRRCDNRVFFARQGSASMGYFMRQSSTEEGDSTSSVAPKPNGFSRESPANTRAPCFARPSSAESGLSDSAFQQPVFQMQSCEYLDPPAFGRPSQQIGPRGEQLHPQNSKIGAGNEWSPRMDVAESKGRYVITVEVPGVSINDMRVEVDDKKLSVKGRRSSSRITVSGGPNASFSSYHKREILHGPYEVAWPLPADVNKDSISAEFLDGFLHIIIPKKL